MRFLLPHFEKRTESRPGLPNGRRGDRPFAAQNAHKVAPLLHGSGQSFKSMPLILSTDGFAAPLAWRTSSFPAIVRNSRLISRDLNP